MSLRAKLGLALFVSVAAFLILDDSLRRGAFQDVFRDVERSRAKVMVLEAKAALQDLSYDLGLAARSDRTQLPVEARRRPLGLPGMSLLVEPGGRVIDLVVTHPTTGAPGTVREIPGENLAATHPFLSRWRKGEPVQGIFETSQGFLLLGSAEVTVPSDDDAPPSRCLSVLGVWMTPGSLPALAGTSAAEVQVIPIYGREDVSQGSPDSGVNIESVPEAAHASLAAGEVAIVNGAAEWGVAYAALEGFRPPANAAIKVALAEPLWVRLQQFERLTSVGVAVLFPLALLFLVQWLVTGPLRRLTTFATEVAAAEDPTKRLRLERGDEIGLLANKFDAMLDDLERSRSAEADAARVVGRSEMAVGVMHNVGNLVNSIQVSASLAQDSIGSIPADDFREILSALSHHQGNLDHYLAEDARGKHLIGYFEALLPQLDSAMETAARESGSVQMRVGKITELLHSLQGEDSNQEMTRRMDLDQEVERAIADVFDGSAIELCVSLDGGGAIEADLHRIREVLLPLFSNAYDAALTRGPGERRVAVTTSRGPNDEARVQVTDSGDGVPADAAEAIFEMGYTKKPERSGLGLHLAALSASELGGSVRLLESAAKAQASTTGITGATFAFEFPTSSARA